jgi:hypothetical protein
MVITQLDQACGFVQDETFHPFDSPVCLIKTLDSNKKAGKGLPVSVYFSDYLTSRLLAADSVSFLMTRGIATVMNSGVLCFADKDSARSYQKSLQDRVVGWTEYQALQRNPDKVLDITLSPTGLQPETTVLNKNEIVEWRFRGENLTSDVILRLQGYEELGDIPVAASGDVYTLRMFADKPGVGFAFLSGDRQTPVGMVKVMGGHTIEEEEM